MIPDFHGPIGEQTVPNELLGCWRRNWIRYEDGDATDRGEPDRSVTVIWLQTASGMGDLRLDPRQVPEDNDSSCGITVVEPTTPLPTADWLDGPTGFAQQVESSFPEKGWLAWDSPTVMRELAPSGSYVEEWEKLTGSDGDLIHLTAPAAPTLTNLYIAGRHYFLAVQASADETVHQFSYGEGTAANTIEIELSTIAAMVSTPMRLDYEWVTVSHRRLR